MRIDRVQSFLFTLFLFCFSLLIPLLNANVAVSQVSGRELATEARSLYHDREYRGAVGLWQEAAKTFAQQQDPYFWSVFVLVGSWL